SIRGSNSRPDFQWISTGDTGFLKKWTSAYTALLINSAVVQRWTLCSAPNSAPRKSNSSRNATNSAVRPAERHFEMRAVAEESAGIVRAPLLMASRATQASDAKPRANPAANLRQLPAGGANPTS